MCSSCLLCLDIKFVKVEYCQFFIGILFVSTCNLCCSFPFHLSYPVVSAVALSCRISLAIQVVWVTQKTCLCPLYKWHRENRKTYIGDTLVPSYWEGFHFGVGCILVHAIFYMWHKRVASESAECKFITMRCMHTIFDTLTVELFT